MHERATYAAAWQHFVENFNTGQYLACVLPLEEIWLIERDNFHTALIRLCVALNQLQLGLLTSPRFLLQTANDLLAPYEPSYASLDIGQLRSFIASCAALIPADRETGEAGIDATLLPSFRFPSGSA